MRRVKSKEHETGLALGAMMALVHAVWAVLVWLGWAQPFLDWIFTIHSLANPYFVLPFDLARSLMLVTTTFVIGYFFGWVFANIWNRVVKRT